MSQFYDTKLPIGYGGGEELQDRLRKAEEKIEVLETEVSYWCAKWVKAVSILRPVL